MTTDLWDWADVAAINVAARIWFVEPACVLSPSLSDEVSLGLRRCYADAIRYGYEQAQKDFGATTGTGRSQDSGEGRAVGFGKEPQGEPQQKPEAMAAQDVPPVAASEFPRVWVMARDESRDVWVFESGDCLEVTEYQHYEEHQEHYSVDEVAQ